MSEISQGEDGHGGKKVIIVNTREHVWEKHEISYEEVVELAFPGQPPTDIIGYTVDWEHNHDSGSLTKGQKVEVKNKMIFHVSKTNRS